MTPEQEDLMLALNREMNILKMLAGKAGARATVEALRTVERCAAMEVGEIVPQMEPVGGLSPNVPAPTGAPNE